MARNRLGQYLSCISNIGSVNMAFTDAHITSLHKATLTVASFQWLFCLPVRGLQVHVHRALSHHGTQQILFSVSTTPYKEQNLYNSFTPIQVFRHSEPNPRDLLHCRMGFGLFCTSERVRADGKEVR